MEAVLCKGSSPGPGTLSRQAARAGSSPTPRTAAGALFFLSASPGGLGRRARGSPKQGG